MSAANVGVAFDSRNTFGYHITKVCHSCHYDLGPETQLKLSHSGDCTTTFKLDGLQLTELLYTVVYGKLQSIKAFKCFQT